MTETQKQNNTTVQEIKRKRTYTPEQLERKRVCAREYVKKNRERLTLKVKEWRRNNPERYKELARKHSAKRRLKLGCIPHGTPRPSIHQQVLDQIPETHLTKTRGEAIYIQRLFRQKNIAYKAILTNQGYRLKRVVR